MPWEFLIPALLAAWGVGFALGQRVAARDWLPRFDRLLTYLERRGIQPPKE